MSDLRNVVIVSDGGMRGLRGLPGADSVVPGPPGAASTVPGPPGDDGRGVPNGGTTGQVLTKLGATNGDADWETPAVGGGGGGGPLTINDYYGHL